MIDTKLLRQKLIDMALRGQLVEQRPEDGHATDLLEQIRTEKAALIKAGKIKKEKPLPEIKEEEKPFTIPANWCWVRLGEIVEVARGGSPRPIKRYLTDSDDGINWIKIGDTNKGDKYINKTAEKIIPEGVSKSRLVHRGDFLLSNSMSFGRPYILNIDGCIHDGWLVLSKFDRAIDKEFLYYLLSSSLVIRQFKNRAEGAVVDNLNSEKVALTVISLPPLAEQKRIVTALESCLKLVDTIAKDSADLDKALKFLRQKVLDMAVRGQLVEQRPEDGNATDLLEQIRAEKAALIKAGKIKKEKPLPEIKEEDKPFSIPANWCWVRLGELCKKVGAGSTPTGGKAVYKDCGPMLLRSQNVYNDGLRLNEVARFDAELWSNRSSHVLPNDLLLNITASALGRSAIVPSLFEDADVNQHVLILRQVVLDTVYYVHKAIISPCVQAAIMRAQVGTTREGLSALNASRLLIPLPPLAEQKRIVAKLEQINALIETAFN